MKVCCSDPASICYWLIVSLAAWVVLAIVGVVGSRTGAMLRRFGLAVAPRFLWVGIELGRTSLEGGGLPSSPFRSARRGHNSTKAAFPEAPYNAGCPNFSGPV